MTEELPGGWGPTLADLAERRQAARAMGGTQRLEKHRASGRLDARARIERLLDPGSFREIGTLVGGEVPADAIVTGSGRISGRPVLVGAEDFTTLAGTIASGSNSKRYRIAELALRERMPLIMLLEGAGFRPTGAGHGRSPTDLIMQAQCSGRVPVITGILGASAGHGALIAPMSDFAIMTEQASVFTAGPPVVKDSTGEVVSKHDLGGPRVAVASGLIHNEAPDDVTALDEIRRYLSYFPSSAWSYPTTSPASEGRREVPEVLGIVPRDNRRVYDMRRVLDVVFDSGSAFEIQPGFGKAIICRLARLGGAPVAVVANQPQYLAGSVDADAADKAAHFIAVADAFHVPLIFFADNPGMLPGTASERAGVLRSGARMFAAQTGARVPKIHLTLRKAYGFGSMVMSLVGWDQQSATFAYPGATMGAMGASAQSSAAKSPEEEAAALRRAEIEASYRSAASLGFDELIDPRETRNVLLDALERALNRRQGPAEPAVRSAIWP